MARSRSTVMGFTEAELGFILAALFIAVAGSALAKVRTVSAEALVKPDTTVLAGRIQVLRRENDQLREENDQLRALTSQMTPSCDERGETSASVARVTVVAAGSYEFEGNAVPIDSVLARLSFWIDKGKAKRCRFFLDVLARPELRANEFIQASNSLARHFYLRRVSGGANRR